MNNESKITLPSLEGELSVYKTFLSEDGSVSEELLRGPSKNRITDNAGDIALRALLPLSSADKLSYARIGVGGAEDVSGTILKVPASSMVNLYDPRIQCPIYRESVENVGGRWVLTLVIAIDSSQGNGLVLNEYGLFSDSGIMFAIKTFAGIPKDGSFGLRLKWKIKL